MKVSRETIVGAFTAIAITILILGYNFLKGNNLFSKSTRVMAVYPETAGLIKSNQVVYKGLRVGTVSDLSIEEITGKIVAELEIDGDILIPNNSTARIISSDLLGTKAVEIIFGSGGNGYVASGDTLIGENEPSLEDQINKQVLPVKVKAENLLGSLDSLTSQLQYIFKEEKVDQGLQQFLASLDNIKRTTSKIDGFVSNETSRLALFLANITAVSDTLSNSMGYISQTLKNVSNISDSLAEQNFVAELASTLKNANETFSELKDLSSKLNSSESSAGLLMNDPKLYNNLNQAISDLDKLLVEMNEYPSMVIFNRDKRKKEKKNN